MRYRITLESRNGVKASIIVEAANLSVAHAKAASERKELNLTSREHYNVRSVSQLVESVGGAQ